MPRARKHQDAYFHKAKREGYVARSAYKLIEIDDRRRTLRRGDVVLDLGCAPGSWLQVATERVGPTGRVVGVDLQPVEAPGLGGNVTTMEADAFEVDAALLLQAAGLAETERFDVVLSDMAPKTSGGAGGAGDHFLSVRLCERVLELAERVLRPGGNLVMKVFEGEQYPDLLKRCGRLFEDAKGFKPKSSREVSREMFIVGRGYKGVTEPAPAGRAG